MLRIVGKSVRVVETDDLAIDELAGNVASNEDTLSVARVVVSKPTSEPWLTLHYDEWICVLKGRVEMHFHENNDSTKEKTVLTVEAGETCFVPEGQRFRPVFPIGDTEYVPVCIPAFKPERCIREEDGVSDVAERLRTLHDGNGDARVSSTTDVSSKCDKVYHMCQKTLWEQALSSKTAYYPPTFVEDGHFTHATAVADRLMQTANHFYTAIEGEWICVEMDVAALKALGISVRFEQPLPVGDQPVSADWMEWACPHVYGGIPCHVEGVVTRVCSITRDRDTGAFLGIDGITE